jgi:hypothetical protein
MSESLEPADSTPDKLISHDPRASIGMVRERDPRMALRATAGLDSRALGVVLALLIPTRPYPNS